MDISNEVIYARLSTEGGYADKRVDSVDISKLKINKDVFKVSFRRTWMVKVAVNNKNAHSEKETPLAIYYIGEIVTKQDAQDGKIDKNSTAYSWLMNDVEKQMLKGANGKFYKIEKGGIVLSPADFVDGYYVGQDLNV